MSDSPSSTTGSSGFERRWRNEEKTSFKSLNKQSRLILMSLAVVLVGSVIAGSFYLWGYAKEPKLYCLPVSEYGERWPSPFWYYHDAKALLQTVPQSSQNFSVKQQKNDILALLTGLASNQEPTTIIYLAGLGARRGEKVYLLPADARPEDPASWLSMDEVFEKIKALPCEHILLLLDIASPLTNLYQGPLIDDIADALDRWLTANIASNNRLLVLTSCSAGEVSQPMASQGKTAFGYYLQKGLQGQANGVGPQGNMNQYVTAQELSTFVRTRVNRWSIQNRGQPQHPKLYGSGDCELVHIDKVVVPVASKNEPGNAASETKPESKEEKEKRVKKEQDAENRIVTSIFPDRLQTNWQLRDKVIIPFISPSPATVYGRLDYPEHELHLAILRKLENTLHFYENTTLMFMRELQSDEAIQESPFKLLQRVEIKTQQDNVQLQQLLSSQSWQETSSLSALFPRETQRTPTIELENAYRSAFSSLTATSNAVSKTDKPAEPFSPAALIDVVKEIKVEKDGMRKRSGQHREMLYLCWKNLCQDINPTLEKCVRTEQVLKALINDWKYPLITQNCMELQLLEYLIRLQKSTWNYSDQPEVDRLMMGTLHAWLQLEFSAMQLLPAFLPNGLGFQKHQAAIQSISLEHQNLAVELKQARRSDDFKKLTPRIEALARRYQVLMQTVDIEHLLHAAWWKSLATILATAEMMITSDAEKVNDWTNLVSVSLVLAADIEQGQNNQETTNHIMAVETARLRLLNHYQQFATKLIDPAAMQSADATACIALERALQGGLLSSEDRKEVYRQLIKLHYILHERTTQSEASDTTGQDTALPASGTPQLHATRRSNISKALLQLAGMGNVQIPASDWEKSAIALREAWYKQASEQLILYRNQGKWFQAARLEAVLPDSNTLDSIVELRKKESVPYLNWLKQRQEESIARWK